MRYFILYTALLALFIGCKQSNQNINSTKKEDLQKDLSIITNDKGVGFLKEFYTKYYGEYRDRRGIENYVSSRILMRMDSLTKGDELILDYDPFIKGQDWDINILINSLEIKLLDDENKYRVSFFRNENNDEKTKIDFLLKNNSEGKLLIYSILNDKYLNFSSLNKIPINEKQNNFNDEWIGNYDCNFLRMKEESADPRAYGMIYINIDNNEAKFKLDTYVEIIDKDLIVLSCNSTEIILAERDNQKSKFTITKNNKKYELKSDLLNNTVGEISTYELIKK